MPDPSLFKTAPKEVVDYFDRRPSVPTFDWRDIAPHEHALAHTVAKTAGFDVLDDLRGAIRKAVVERIPYEQFRDELIPVLRQKGWWGEKKRVDPVTGEVVKAQLGSLRRLETIYWGNVYSAHAAGEWARIERNKTFLPWLTYMPSVSERKRPEHQSWYGVTLRVDDSWWRSHYPPNGWNCKCSVRQIGDMEAGELRAKHGEQAPPLEEKDWLNKRTGETQKVPKGIDPGWQTNPGLLRDRTLTRQLQGALDRMPEEPRRKVVEKLLKHPVFDYAAETLGSKGQKALTPEQASFSSVAAVMPAGRRTRLGATTSIVRLSGDSAAHIRDGHPEVTPAILSKIQIMLDDGEAYIDRLALVFFHEIEGELYRLTVKRTVRSDEMFISTMHRANEDQLARWRKRGKIEE